jgi:formylglycine-generating enzyme required for sulfatase activity/CheY-like chemotaxis protein
MNVLLVDDDPAVIHALMPVLKSDADIDLRVATSGDKAIENAGALGHVDVLVTDVVMLPMDGFVLRDELKSRFPGLKTVFITGFDLSDFPEQTNGHTVLIKPVDAAELLEAVTGRAPAPAAPAAPPVAVAPPAVPAAPTPAAVPFRPPAATPVAPTPRPTPAIQPPAATPAPAKPQPTAAPAPTPPAPAPKPAAMPAVPRGVAPRAATPAAPVAKPAATSVAKPAAVIPPMPVRMHVPKASTQTAEPPPPKLPAQAADRSPEDLSGSVLGLYKINRKLGEGFFGGVYHAVQTSMNRPVAFKVLSKELESDPAAKERFIADAQAKAAAQHPFILTVYEAGNASGRTYYTQEFVEGSNLADLIENGESVDPPTALKIIRTAVEGLSYFGQHHTPHRTIAPASLYLSPENRPRLANLATSRSEEALSTQQEIQTLAQIISQLLPGGIAADPGLAALLAKMSTAGPGGFPSWGALLQAVQALEPKVVPVEAHRISKQDEDAIRAVESAKKVQQRQLLWSVLAIFALLWVVAGAVWWTFFRSGEKSFDIMVEIAGGDFTYGEGADQKTINLPTFWIDKYEVTLGQYAKFVEFLKKNPTTQFDHPKQPKGKTHVPLNWDIYYGRASSGLKKYRNVKYVPLDLNCPAFLVDWWDAYAYAKWKGRRLPTEQEWEKAGRGTKGVLFPWGNEWDPKKCNSGADFSQSPGPNYKAKVDGYVWWNPVDASANDTSPFGVVGLVGNVAEWTDSWDTTGKFPVIRGGSYHSPPRKLTERVAELDPERSEEFIGFRTASSEPPGK